MGPRFFEPIGTNNHRERGIYKRIPGTDIWWIHYADASGRIRREKDETKGAAINLYRKRKTEILQGRNLPETLRARAVRFSEVNTDARKYVTDITGARRLMVPGSPN